MLTIMCLLKNVRPLIGTALVRHLNAVRKQSTPTILSSSQSLLARPCRGSNHLQTRQPTRHTCRRMVVLENSVTYHDGRGLPAKGKPRHRDATEKQPPPARKLHLRKAFDLHVASQGSRTRKVLPSDLADWSDGLTVWRNVKLASHAVGVVGASHLERNSSDTVTFSEYGFAGKA